MGFIGTFLDCLRKWEIEPEGKMEEAEVIIAQSFGFRRDDSGLSPGLSNEGIARKVLDAALRCGLPMILQWEIADALLTKPKELSLYIIREHRDKGEYLDTEEVLFQTKEIMDERGWKRAMVFAHPWHIWRVKKQAEKAGIEVIIPPWLNSIPFDPKSDQWWTRNKFVWRLREAPARVFLLLKGKI